MSVKFRFTTEPSTWNLMRYCSQLSNHYSEISQAEKDLINQIAFNNHNPTHAEYDTVKSLYETVVEGKPMAKEVPVSTLLQTIKEHYKKRPDQAKLTETTLISELEPSEIQQVIEVLYKEKDLNMRLLATVLNSIFTQHRGVFLFSYRICQDLIKNDKNIKRKSLNGDEYYNFMINTEGKFLERISEACEDKRATVFRLRQSAPFFGV